MKQHEHGGQVIAAARRLGLDPGDILDFSASINPLGPAPAVREAVWAAFDQVVHYPDSRATQLQEALAAAYHLDPARVVPGNGSTELIFLLPRMLREPRWRRALVIAPPFAEYARALRQDGWRVDYFSLSPEDGFDLHLERLRHRLQVGYDLLILANPGNPTGRLYDRREIARLASDTADARMHLVIDEAFMDFCPDASALPLVEQHRHLIILRSMTKFHAIPGLRLGFAVTTPPLAERLQSIRSPWSINVLAQAAGLAALTAKDHHAATLDLINRERAALTTTLADLPGVSLWPGAANYLLLQFSSPISTAGIAEALESRRILIRRCGSFQGLDDSFVRIAVRTDRENRLLVGALSEVIP